MKKYRVTMKWFEIHEAIVDAETEIEAGEKFQLLFEKGLTDVTDDDSEDLEIDEVAG